MRYMLFIDDIRFPANLEWVIARDSAEAIDFITRWGMPDEISFDYDLGGDDTAMNVVKFIIDAVLSNKVKLLDGFKFHVHSANPVGAKNIQETLGGFLDFMEKEYGWKRV